MHPQQKMAWFTLIVILGTILLYVAAVPTMSWWLHRPWTDTAAPMLGLFGLTGLTGFARKFYHAPTGGPMGKEPVMDERDLLLSRQAWSMGMGIFWLLFGVAGMGAWAYLRYARGVGQITVPVEIFPCIIFAGGIVQMLASALAILHAYGWRANHVSGQ